MRALAILGLTASIAILPAAVEARSDSKPRVTKSQTRALHHRWGPHMQGRWHAGWQAPGGWDAYRRPARGYVVPHYWFSPGYYVGDYPAYGLPHPPYGLAWSRYYDDAVLIDGRGTVYDSVSGVDWNGYGREDRRREDGVGGAIIGGAVGAIAGNRIGGRGNRLGGTLIGAGVGALAGMAIDKAEDRTEDRDRPVPHYGAGQPRPYDYDFGPYDERIAGAEQGRWTGNWDGRYVDSENRRYEGTFRGTYEGPTGADYAAPDYREAHGYPMSPQPAYGYAQAMPMMMVPVSTTTTTTVEEDVPPSAAKRVTRRR